MLNLKLLNNYFNFYAIVVVKIEPIGTRTRICHSSQAFCRLVNSRPGYLVMSCSMGSATGRAGGALAPLILKNNSIMRLVPPKFLEKHIQ